MSAGEALDAPGIIAAPSPLETVRFGLSIDRISVSAASAAAPATATERELIDAVGASAADVIIVRYPAEQVTWYAALAAQGRTALLADTLVYWRLSTGLGRGRPRPAPIDIVPVTEIAGGVAVAEELVGEIFTDYRNHYAANPLFDRDRIRAGYREWARRSVATGRSLLMYEGRERPVPIGLAVCEARDGRTEILLAGVVPSAQGRGTYGHLLAAVEERALEERIQSVVISTQGHNTRVQRAWARHGFEPVHTMLTVHLVRPELLDGSGGPVRAAVREPATGDPR